MGPETRDTEITVRIGDMDPSTSGVTGVGNQDIAAGALVSLSFSNGAGLGKVDGQTSSSMSFPT